MNISDVNPKINDEWKTALQNEFKQPYFLNIKKVLIDEKKKFTIYPPGNKIFSAYNFTPLNCVKVVIIGQDPYHGPHQANGLCFSVEKGIHFPPSLENIFKELKSDLGIPIPSNGDLSLWAKQGVMLLNATLTVRKGEANSHSNIGWQKFTDATIKAISDNRENVIFLLWGGFAKKKAALIDKNKHYILTSGHPSPLSANKGYWFGNKHFSKTNEILKKLGKEPIDWRLE